MKSWILTGGEGTGKSLAGRLAQQMACPGDMRWFLAVAGVAEFVKRTL